MTHMAVFRSPFFQGFCPFEEVLFCRRQKKICKMFFSREEKADWQTSILHNFSDFCFRKRDIIFKKKFLTYLKIYCYIIIFIINILYYKIFYNYFSFIFLDQRRRCVSAKWVTGYCSRAFTGRAKRTVGENSRSVNIRGNEYE